MPSFSRIDYLKQWQPVSGLPPSNTICLVIVDCSVAPYILGLSPAKTTGLLTAYIQRHIPQWNKGQQGCLSCFQVVNLEKLKSWSEQVVPAVLEVLGQNCVTGALDVEHWWQVINDLGECHWFWLPMWSTLRILVPDVSRSFSAFVINMTTDKM